MAYLQITLKIADANRAAAAGVYQQYKAPFLAGIAGAQSKQLLVREEDVQVLHGFDSVANANAYLQSALFNSDVVVALTPLLDAAPDVRHLYRRVSGHPPAVTHYSLFMEQQS